MLIMVHNGGDMVMVVPLTKVVTIMVTTVSISGGDETDRE
jgi:hypothetical protein